MNASTLTNTFSQGDEHYWCGLGYRHTKDGKDLRDYRHYISSAALTKACFATTERGHWAAENSMHWVLDLWMKEDQC